MSWQACKYARYVLEDDTELTTGARMILMLKALEIRFPIVEALSTPRADTRGVWINDPARSRAQPRAIPRATPRDPARHTGLLPNTYPADVEPVAKLSRADRDRLIQEGKKSAHG